MKRIKVGDRVKLVEYPKHPDYRCVGVVRHTPDRRIKYAGLHGAHPTYFIVDFPTIRGVHVLRRSIRKMVKRRKRGGA